MHKIDECHDHVESEDEWEETTLVVEVNGVLDAQMVRRAVSLGQVSLRRPETDKPILQIANSLYTGKWSKTVGTDIILEASNGQLKVLSTTDTMLKTEKALLTAMPNSDTSASHQHQGGSKGVKQN
ncbi:unnamed protein product [Auanema sp. JU1783]|nr:unnamed protein product [Auanema sp. JU1783]